MQVTERQPLTLDELNALLVTARMQGIAISVDGAGNTKGLTMDMRQAVVPVGSSDAPAEAIAFVIYHLQKDPS